MAENAALRVGEMAPDFELMNQDKRKIRLSDFRGRKKVVLLFYPMDFSPVCTEEHCEFGPRVNNIARDDDTVIFGVSCDSPYTHAAFRQQYNIPYDLLSDTSRNMAKAYGMFAGEVPYNCTKRGTVIIGKDGRITFYAEVPPKEPRKAEDVSKAVEVAIAQEQRANEFGVSV
jgi:peroxiredoxin